MYNTSVRDVVGEQHDVTSFSNRRMSCTDHMS